MSIRGSKTDNVIRDEIKEEWSKHGWDWDSHTGQATIRLLPIVSAIMTKELTEFSTMVKSLSDTININEMTSDRAKDAVMLYNALKRSGMQEEGLSYAVYAFLIGDKASEYHLDIMNSDKKGE